jgi:hypothetical protein
MVHVSKATGPYVGHTLNAPKRKKSMDPIVQPVPSGAFSATGTFEPFGSWSQTPDSTCLMPNGSRKSPATDQLESEGSESAAHSRFEVCSNSDCELVPRPWELVFESEEVQNRFMRPVGLYHPRTAQVTLDEYCLNLTQSASHEDRQQVEDQIRSLHRHIHATIVHRVMAALDQWTLGDVAQAAWSAKHNIPESFIAQRWEQYQEYAKHKQALLDDRNGSVEEAVANDLDELINRQGCIREEDGGHEAYKARVAFWDTLRTQLGGARCSMNLPTCAEDSKVEEIVDEEDSEKSCHSNEALQTHDETENDDAPARRQYSDPESPVCCPHSADSDQVDAAECGEFCTYVGKDDHVQDLIKDVRRSMCI